MNSTSSKVSTSQRWELMHLVEDYDWMVECVIFAWYCNGRALSKKDPRRVPETRLGKKFKTRLVPRRTVTTKLNQFCKRQTWFYLHWFYNKQKNNRKRESNRWVFLQPRQDKNKTWFWETKFYSRGCILTPTTSGQGSFYRKIYGYMTHPASANSLLSFSHTRSLHVRSLPYLLMTMRVVSICANHLISHLLYMLPSSVLTTLSPDNVSVLPRNSSPPSRVELLWDLTLARLVWEALMKLSR